MPAEPEPKPTFCTLDQLQTAYQNWIAFKVTHSDMSIGTIPDEGKGLREFVLEQVPTDDQGDREGKLYISLRSEDITEIPGHDYGVVVRNELARIIERFFEETIEQKITIPHEIVARENKTYIQLASTNPETKKPSLSLKGWIAETYAQSWPGSPKTLAVGSKIAEAIKAGNQVIVEIGRPLENTQSIFGDLPNPN